MLKLLSSAMYSTKMLPILDKIAMIVLLFCLGILIVIAIFVSVRADYTETKFSNDWIWKPFNGASHYVLEKTTDSGTTWIIIDANIPSTTIDYHGEEVIRYTIVSIQKESYQIRYKAVDADGNESQYSPVSDILHIVSPETPVHVTE